MPLRSCRQNSSNASLGRLQQAAAAAELLLRLPLRVFEKGVANEAESI